MRYEDEVQINAPIDEVWRLTANIAGWPSFTPTMTGIKRLDAGPCG